LNERLENYIFRTIGAELDGIKVGDGDNGALDTVLEQARETLKEVKALTEYQDQRQRAFLLS